MSRSQALLAAALILGSACAAPSEGDYFEANADKSDTAASSRFRAGQAVLDLGDMQQVSYTGAGPWTGACGPGMTSGATKLRDYLRDRFPQIESIGGFSCRHIVGNANQASVHSTGRALDIMLPLGFRNDADNAKGDPIANFLIANAEDIGIQYFIWDRTSWGASRAAGNKERVYRGAHPHNDHLHVELSPEASREETAWLEPGWLPLEVDESLTNVPPQSEDGSVPAESEPVPLDTLPPEPPADPPEQEAPQDPAEREEVPEELAPKGPCLPLPAKGGTLDTDSGCLWLRGPANYWNYENEGHEGSLAWTTVVQSGGHTNSAEWEINLETAGSYEVWVYASANFSRHDRVRYDLNHGQAMTPIVVDLSAVDGWSSLGVYEFAEGNGQRLTLFDNNDGAVEPGSRIVADAIMLRPPDSGNDNSDDPSDPPEEPTPLPEPTEPDESGSGTSHSDPAGSVTSGCQQAPGNTPIGTILFLITALFCIRKKRSDATPQ